MRGFGSGFYGGYPGCGAGVEYVERKRAAVEDLVVEGADVVLGTKLFFGAVRSSRIFNWPSL